MIASYELFGFMPSEMANEIIEWAYENEKPLYRALLKAVADIKRVRPVYLERQPRAQRHQLVLATLHTNTAPGAVIRLLDMGVESYLLASSLIGILSQRLVRTICQNCKEVYKPVDEEVKELSPELIGADVRFYRGKGCHLCKGTGYGGRTGLHELMVMNEELRRTTMRDPSTNTLTSIARKFGMKTLREDGIQKVIQGITTISEVLYATKKDTEER